MSPARRAVALSSPHVLRRALTRTLVAGLLLLSLHATVFTARRERLAEGWRPTHYDVTLEFDGALSEVTRAETKISITALRDTLELVDLDFGTMAVDGVSVDDQPAPYERSSNRLNVTLPRPARRGQQLTLAVRYHGRPADGLILSKDKYGRPSATGDNWPDRVHHWMPSLDHPSAKATVAFKVTAPADKIVVANGRLLGAGSNLDATRWWSWHQSTPIPPYCMIVAVGEFAKVVPGVLTDRRIAPLAYYVPRSEQTRALTGFVAAPPALSFFNRLVAPYPYEKLAHVVGATRFGGMENASAIVYASALLDPRHDEPVSPRFGVRRGLVEVVAHETAHQWFGDAVTPATWADLWLSEGFATYFTGLFIEGHEGAEAFRAFMRRNAEAYLKYERTRRAPIHDRETEDLNALLNANNYQKGAWVLHMLRRRLGDAAFFRGVRAYYRRHLHASATTEDLRAAMERASGRNLRAFFARWVYGSGHPRYELRWEWRQRGKRAGLLALTLRQTQEGEPFPDPVPVEVITPARRLHIVMRPTGRTTAMLLHSSSRPSEVRLDPEDALLNEMVLMSEAKTAARAGY